MEQLLIPYRSKVNLPPGGKAVAGKPAAAEFSEKSPLRSAAMLTPLGPKQLPPPLARGYPERAAGPDSQWGKSHGWDAAGKRARDGNPPHA